MSKISILVTGIGGMVAQGVLRRLRASNRDLRLFGTNTTRLSTGNYLCETVAEVPPAIDPRYPDAIRRFCTEQEIALIIPCTDAEVAVLSQHRNELPSVAAASATTASICFDKWKTFEALSSAKISFAASILPSAYDGRLPRTIVKPRKGAGSRSIYIDPPNPAEFSDDYVVQELIEGVEITIALYRCRSGKIVGPLTMRRELKGGATNICEATHQYDEKVNPLVAAIADALDLRGSCNIQAIVDASGRVTPFEINCRISGTHAMRVCFGFDDVEFLLSEWLDNVEPSPPRITPGVVFRVTREVFFPGATMLDVIDAKTFHLEVEH